MAPLNYSIFAIMFLDVFIICCLLMETTAARREGILMFFLITDRKILKMYCDTHTRLTRMFVIGNVHKNYTSNLVMNSSIIGKH